MRSHMRHSIQVVPSQPPGIRLLHNLLLFTVSFLFTRLFPFLRKWIWLARLVELAILSSLIAISLLPLSSVFHLWLYLPLYFHLRLTDSHSRPRKIANWPTNALRACLLGVVQILQRGSKYYHKIWTRGPITTRVQILRERTMPYTR